MRILRIKNYEKYQNHRAKDPRWVKLYRSVLTDQAFIKLDPVSRYVYLGLVILASETGNSIVNDVPYLCHRLAMNATQLNLKPLICSGLIVASLRTIQRQKSASETETETETETEREGVSTQPTTIALVIRSSVLPDGFQFNERAEEMAKGYGLNVHKEFAAFRDHHVAKGSLFRDWQAAFRTWLRNSVKFAAKGVR